jgi:hypothetical protein
MPSGSTARVGQSVGQVEPRSAAASNAQIGYRANTDTHGARTSYRIEAADCRGDLVFSLEGALPGSMLAAETSPRSPTFHRRPAASVAGRGVVPRDPRCGLCEPQ